MIGGRGGTASAKARLEKTLKRGVPRLIAVSPSRHICQLRATNLPRFYAPDLASTRVCVTSKPAVTGESLVHVTGSNACASGKAECVRALSWYTPAVRPRGRNPRFLFSPVVPKLVTVCPYVPNLTQRDGTGAVPMGFLDAAGGGGGLARRLSGELLAGGLATGGLTSSLLCSCHVCLCRKECRRYFVAPMTKNPPTERSGRPKPHSYLCWQSISNPLQGCF